MKVRALGFDIIGDIHGQAEMLKKLLEKMGYHSNGKSWHNSYSRKAIFVGDLIDRGPLQQETVEIVQAMVNQNDALCIMGNHEFNAIQYSLGLRELKGDSDPHQSFLSQVPVGSREYENILSWFRELPLWLDMGQFGVVHACWDKQGMRLLEEIGLGPDHILPEEFYFRAAEGKDTNSPDRRIFLALENILKGPELDLPEGVFFYDKDGNKRRNVRTRWYKSGMLDYRDISFTDVNILEGSPFENSVLYEGKIPEKPVYIGHYWLDKDSDKKPLSDKVVCVDYSAGIDGPLVAYRWNSGDFTFRQSAFVEVT